MAYGDSGGLDGAPDSGTLGGNMSDDNGETSATMGGGLSDAQGYSNEGVNANPYGYDFSSAGYSDPGAFGLGDLFGYNSSTGLPTNGGAYAGNPDTYGFNDFAQSPFGKTVRGLMSMTPVGRVANTAYGMMTAKDPMSVALGLAPGLAGVAARTGYSAMNSPNPGGVVGNTLGGLAGSAFGGAVGGPVGSTLGGMLGSTVGRAAGSGTSLGTGPSTAQSGGSGGDLFTNLGTGLAGLYTGYQANKAASNNANAINGQISSLSNMYGQNSPYAAALRQQLARKDAASGRNSQYGPREAQLQALLADKAASTAGTIGNLSTQAQSANTASQTARAQQLAQLLKLGQSSGLGNYLQQGLGQLFGNSGGGSFDMPAQYQNNDEYGY